MRSASLIVAPKMQIRKSIQADLVVQPRVAKIYACAVGQITFRSPPRPAPDKRDVSRSSRTFGAGCDGRVWRIRRMRRMRTAKLWRPDASTLASSRQGNPAGDGGKKARSPGRPQRKPLKPSRRECRIVSANLWWLTRVLFTFAHEAAGEPNARHSLRPLLFERALFRHNSGETGRENAGVRRRPCARRDP